MDKINKVLYSIQAESTDGREGNVASESGRLSFKLAKPETMGGSGDPESTNPEELFACGYAACFGGAVEYVAQQRKIDIGSPTIQAKVHFGLAESGVALAVDIRGKMDNVDDVTALEIMNEAHEQVCPYSKATRGNIDVTIGLIEG